MSSAVAVVLYHWWRSPIDWCCQSAAAATTSVFCVAGYSALISSVISNISDTFPLDLTSHAALLVALSCRTVVTTNYFTLGNQNNVLISPHYSLSEYAYIMRTFI